MSLITGALIGGVICLVICHLVRRKQHSQNGYPDGPFCLPLLGNIPQVALSGTMVDFMNNYRNKFGDVFSTELGGMHIVILSGYETIHEVYVSNAMYSSGRVSDNLSPAWRKIHDVSPGVFFSAHPHWKTLRSFVMNLLKDDGDGIRSTEQLIQQEANYFCQHVIEPKLSTPISVDRPFSLATSNVISGMVFSGRSDYDDAEMNMLIDSLEKSIKLEMTAAFTQHIPFMEHFEFSGLKTVERVANKLMGTMAERFNESKNTFDPDNPKNMFDLFLSHRQKYKQGEWQERCLTDGNGAMLAFNLFTVGTDTTANSLSWALLYTCAHPKVMQKVQKEITEQIGREKTVSYVDRRDMPYTEAVLLETLRLSNITIIGLPHTTSADIVVKDKIIPAGTHIFPNMSSVLHDPEVFEDPYKFNPDRYLTGDVKLKKQRTIPFFLGRRSCLGEKLAKMELFIFYVTILQRYNLMFPDYQLKPSLYPEVLMISKPQPYEIIFNRI